MAYFSNGAEGERYQTQYCMNCLNWEKRCGDAVEESCPIWDAHMMYNYTKSDKAKAILEGLIPTNDDTTFAEKCTMFQPTDDCAGQLKVEY